MKYSILLLTLNFSGFSLFRQEKSNHYGDDSGWEHNEVALKTFGRNYFVPFRQAYHIGEEASQLLDHEPGLALPPIFSYSYEHKNPESFKSEEVESLQFSIGPEFNKKRTKEKSGNWNYQGDFRIAETAPLRYGYRYVM